jgi:hypothetical protein
VILVQPIPELAGSVTGGSCHPEYAVWIREDGFAIEKDGKNDSPYFLLMNERKEWNCTCPCFIYRGYCKHQGIVRDILKDAILEGRLK